MISKAREPQGLKPSSDVVLPTRLKPRPISEILGGGNFHGHFFNDRVGKLRRSCFAPDVTG